ncbi:hypothetical protein LIER_12021 [Lithospermum erythrorhizon]|uniref:DUF4283 domain-containing protein n=1 Tax=Lithospermum erythrorhizon TaxID=34254 RepID=A0AAV3PT64_LITER
MVFILQPDYLWKGGLNSRHHCKLPCETASPLNDLSRVLGSLSLERGELSEFCVPDVAYDRVEDKYQFSLVAKVFTMRRFHLPTFKDTIKTLWGGQEGIQVLDMGSNLFHGSAIFLKRWEPEMQIDSVVFDTLPYWVQIWNLPMGYVDVDFGRAIGAHIGEVIEVDKQEY